VTGPAPAGHADRELRAAEARAEEGMLVAWWAARQPETLAIGTPRDSWTYAELNARANRLARALRARGLAAGDSLALICGNRREFAEVLVACLRAGWRLTPINWHLSAAEASYVVDDCEAKAIVADASFASVAAGIAGSAARATVRLAVGGDIDGFGDYETTVGAEGGEDLADPCLGSAMLYTSGTTGRPKGVHRAHQGPYTPASVAMFGYRPGDVHLCTGPLYHAAPLAFSLAVPLAAGASVVLMESFDPRETLRLVEAHKVTHTHMVPTMFHRLLALPSATRGSHDLSSLRHVLHGAAPCPPRVKARLIDWLGPIVVEYYAATEGTATYVDSATWLARPGTVGRPAVEDSVRILGTGGEILARGEVGYVYIKTPEPMRFEYFKDPAKTSSSYRGDYFTVGDMGYLDGEGFLYLTDRSANLIISGGVNIYPAEVDAVLLEHPGVADAATIGVPNEEWGEEVKAVVEPKAGVEPSPELADELIDYCRSRLARFKCPRSVDFVEELPRQDNGKIYKRLLRDRYRVADRSPGPARTS
jgi:long-chain acyl-CoA synthetase